MNTIEGTVTTPVNVEAFSGAPGDFQRDIAILAKEREAASPAAVVPVQAEIAPQTPVTTATAPVTTEVPEKFKAADGSLDAEKLEKSTVNAEEALAKYAAKERELRQKMNEVNSLSRQTIPTNVPPPTSTAAPLTAFEIQVANDLINEARAYGYEMPQGQAIAQARVQVKMAVARHDAEASLTEGLRIKLEDQDRRQELEAIARFDPAVLSPEGIDALSKIRDAKPWINNSPKPWTEAYDYYLAEQTKKQRLGGTVLPNPTGLTAKAPPTPVGPAPRAVVQSKGPDLRTPSDYNAHVKGMTAAEEKAFWNAKGLKF